MKDHPLTPTVIKILHQWATTQFHSNQKNNLLNNKNLLHEIEESMIALGSFIEWMNSSMNENDRITIVDICCGKGICSLLASYLFENDGRVDKIIMMDKPLSSSDSNNKNKLDWSHVEFANENAKKERRPIIEARKDNLFETDKIIHWLSSNKQPMAFIGIHLCKNLSPTFIGIANSLGPGQVPFLCLAPCCLPRVVVQSKYNKKNTMLHVAQYEAPLQREARLKAAHLRHNARQRYTLATKKCFLCQSTNHTVHQCELLLATSLEERADILERAAALEPCWKCGKLGHKKKDCPSTQASSLPSLLPKPIVEKKTSHIMHANNPFAAYCDLLSTTIDQDYSAVRLFETGLQNSKSSLLEHQQNWNRERKTIYIVATKSLLTTNK